MRLSPRVREVLEILRRHSEPACDLTELTQAVPGGWWLGNERVGGQVGYFLLRHALIRQTDGDKETMFHYVINEEGCKVLDDPNYVPVVDRLDPGDGVP